MPNPNPTPPHISRVALVTGAGSGIGRRVAESLALGQGARVYVLDRDAEAAAEVVRGINAAGGRAVVCVVDLADGPGLRQTLPSLTAEFGAPDRLLQPAIDLYRRRFRPSPTLAQPYVVIGVPLVAAPTDDEAEFLASSIYQRVLGILTGDRRRLQPPVENFAATLHPQARAAIDDFLAIAVIGGPGKVRAGLARLEKATAADEFMLVCDIFDPVLRLRSLSIAAEVSPPRAATGSPREAQEGARA